MQIASGLARRTRAQMAVWSNPESSKFCSLAIVNVSQIVIVVVIIIIIIIIIWAGIAQLL
jgi:hypothetical protein